LPPRHKDAAVFLLPQHYPNNPTHNDRAAILVEEGHSRKVKNRFNSFGTMGDLQHLFTIVRKILIFI
jgi:hypothetical protein